MRGLKPGDHVRISDRVPGTVERRGARVIARFDHAEGMTGVIEECIREGHRTTLYRVRLDGLKNFGVIAVWGAKNLRRIL